MTGSHPRYTKEEFARRGDELYEKVRLQVEPGNQGKVVAIDIETGRYEVADTGLVAAKRLLTARPEAQPWCVRIGEGLLRRFGAWFVCSRR